jgi:hypothetical protein
MTSGRILNLATIPQSGLADAQIGKKTFGNIFGLSKKKWFMTGHNQLTANKRTYVRWEEESSLYRITQTMN